MSMRRVVVIGSSGFIGSCAVSTLRSSGADVVGYASKDLNLLSEDCVPRLREAIAAEDVLVIVSALTPDRGRDVGTLVRNIQMIEGLCEFLNERPVAHAVYISSDAVYADNAHPVRESSCCDPSTFHGLMHLVRERALLATLKQKRTPFWIVRPCSVYGTGEDEEFSPKTSRKRNPRQRQHRYSQYKCQKWIFLT